MNRLLLVTAVAFAVSGASAFADDADRTVGALEVTMKLMPERATLPDVVTAAIDLPKHEDGTYVPSAAAVEHSARGLETANAARENGRAFGEAMAAAARESREDATHGQRPDPADLPDHVPELPTPPERPDVPDHPTPPNH
jgi:hypothetical protein